RQSRSVHEWPGDRAPMCACLFSLPDRKETGERPCLASSLLPGGIGGGHGCLPGRGEPLLEAGDHRVAAPGGSDCSHVEAGPQGCPTTPDCTPAPHLAALAAEGGHPHQGG